MSRNTFNREGRALEIYQMLNNATDQQIEYLLMERLVSIEEVREFTGRKPVREEPAEVDPNQGSLFEPDEVSSLKDLRGEPGASTTEAHISRR